MDRFNPHIPPKSQIFVREIQTLRTLVRHFHTGAILKSHTAVHIFSYENPEITYTEQEKY